MKRKNLFLFIIVIAIAFSGCKWFQKDEKSQEEIEAARQARIDSIAKAKADSLRKVEQELQKKQAALEKEAAEEQKKQEQARINAQKPYHVIIGSFKNASYADRYAKKMENEGFKTTIIQSDNGFNMVSVGSHQSLNRAARQLTDIREGGNYQVWVYKRN